MEFDGFTYLGKFNFLILIILNQVMVAIVATVVRGAVIKVAAAKLAIWLHAGIDNCGDSGSSCPMLTPSFQS